MDNTLSREVQMQFMRPAQLEAALRAFPAIYVPFGLIEWHGPHLPLGNDALKAHGILVKAAEQHGGVVYPPQWIHAEFAAGREGHLIPVYSELFMRLKRTGARVLIGVTGHNIQPQIDMISKALEPVIADKTCAGIALHEITLSKGPESSSDHAAKWETSNMMFFYPDRVDMSTLGTGPIKLDMKPPYGMGGQDPREHASAEVGARNVELAADAIGRKAHELLESLPPEHRGFSLEQIMPGKWWMV